MKKFKKSIALSISALTFLTAVPTFAQDIQTNEVNEIQDDYEVMNENARGVGGAIAGTIIGAATGTLTGVVGDIISGNDITLGSVTTDFIKGGVTGAIQGSKLPF